MAGPKVNAPIKKRRLDHHRIEGAMSRNQPKFRYVITNNGCNRIQYSDRCSRHRIAGHSPNRHSAKS